MQIVPSQSTHWLDRPWITLQKFTWESIIFIALVVAAAFTRFYVIEPRVMSHDETSHVYFSWLLYQGRGYAHDPVTHGPFQFHLVALSYFLFGDSDTSARIPAVLFSIATIAFAWNFRRYLGRYGALVAALLLIISPYLLYYGRYVRNEAFVGLFFMLNLWALLRYLETGRDKYMLWLTLSAVLHMITKETAFIYMAETLLFAGVYFVYRITGFAWNNRQAQIAFVLLLMLTFLLFGGALYYHEIVTQATVDPATLGDRESGIHMAAGEGPTLVLVGLSLLSLAGALYFLVTGYGLEALRQDRPFSIMLVQGLLTLPVLTPFAMGFLGVRVPVNMSEVNALDITQIGKMAAVVVPAFAIMIGLGLLWKPKQFLLNAALYWGIFIAFYTTFFTNAPGFFTGLVGSLGYWLAQQGVERGSQPWYYYALVQIPIYEFLPALGVFLATGVRIIQSAARKLLPPEDELAPDTETDLRQPSPTFALLLFWSIASLIAFSWAGEKMPWLTFHITLPMILLTAWAANAILATTDWNALKAGKTWIVLALLPVFIASLGASLGAWLISPIAPFSGRSVQELSVTAAFVVGMLGAGFSGVGIAYLLSKWSFGQVARLFTLTFLALLAILTARSAFRASYVNYDNATEYLVYAHSGPGVKIALSQIEDISRRLTGSEDVVIAYDNETTYPYWWYLRNYKNQRYFGTQPTADVRQAVLILVGDANYNKLQPLVGKTYLEYEYIRIWWPNQDYFNLTPQSIWDAISNPQMRAAIFKIWLNRDYSAYATQTTSSSLLLSTWSPAAKMKLFIRKDIAASLWDYGASAVQIPAEADPYAGKRISLSPDIAYGSSGFQAGQFSHPRALAVAPDGTLYVADTGNHRIQRLGVDGAVVSVLQTWGSFANLGAGAAPGGTFNEPWGIAVGPDGAVYVADTWNHRIQKFNAQGQFITMWGYFGQGEKPDAFYGPRAVAVDADNNVYVTDTGNKRIVVFDSNGNFITQFGALGYMAGEFDEPVGLSISFSGRVYVADTWNQRVQSFTPQTGGVFSQVGEWSISGWTGNSLDNKPYLAVGPTGHVFVTDPELGRILHFSAEGALINYWGEADEAQIGLFLPTGIAADQHGGLWVAETGSDRVVHFTLPEAAENSPDGQE